MESWSAILKRKKQSLRKRTRRQRRAIVYALNLFVRRIFLTLPFALSFRLGSLLGMLAYYLLVKERSKTLKNLRMALGGERSEKELRQIARRVFQNAGRTYAEVICWPRLGPAYLKSHVVIENRETLERLVKENRGVIGITAHFGNWEFLGAALTMLMDLPITVIAREYSNPGVNRIMEENRKAMGVHVIYRGKTGLEVFRALRKGHILGILADQNIKGENIEAPFFGQPAPTLKSVGELILRSGCPVIPVFIMRNKDLTTHRMIIENPLFFNVKNDCPDAVKIITETYTRAIERCVRAHPEQWMWMHDRWDRY